MDNASKALIMAGAILISVAIVGIGIYIFTTANALTDDAIGQIDALSVSAVNARLEEYEGKRERGSAVKQLVREVNTLNGQGAMPSVISFDGDSGITGSDSAIKYNAIDDTKRYSIEISGKDSTGYINKITVNKVSK